MREMRLKTVEATGPRFPDSWGEAGTGATSADNTGQHVHAVLGLDPLATRQLWNIPWGVNQWVRPVKELCFWVLECDGYSEDVEFILVWRMWG